MPVAGHPALPKPVGDHGDARSIGQVFGGGKTAAGRQRHTEGFEKIRGHAEAGQAHRVLLVEIAGPRTGFERGHLGERAGIVAQVGQLVGEHELVGIERRHHADRHQPVFPGVRQRTKQHTVDGAEDGRSGAHAKGNGSHRAQRVDRIVKQGTRRVAQILEAAGNVRSHWDLDTARRNFVSGAQFQASRNR
jgi:hypothetical protein